MLSANFTISNTIAFSQDNGKPGEVSLLMEPKNSKDYDKL